MKPNNPPVQSAMIDSPQLDGPGCQSIGKLLSSNPNSRLPWTRSHGVHQNGTQQSVTELPRMLYL